MNRRAEIVLHLDQVDQLIEPCPPSPFLRRRLGEEAEKFIVQTVRNLQRETNINLIIYLLHAEASNALNISAASWSGPKFRLLQDIRRRDNECLRHSYWL